MSRSTSITTGLLVFGLFFAGDFGDVRDSYADGKTETSLQDGSADDNADELIATSRVVWGSMRRLLAQDEPSLVSTEVAARMLKLTAGVTAPGVPLPDLGNLSLPNLDRIPVKRALLTSRFGHRRDPINGRGKMHSGLDFSAKTGTPVRAAGAGIVVKAERQNGYGRIVYIDHGAGFITRYAHLNSIKVKEGETVASGTRIGTVGSSGRVTGPHLHFEVRVHGEAVDPAPFLGIATKGFGQRLRDLLTLPARTKSKNAKKAKTRG